MAPPVGVDVARGVATITLDREPRLNALTFEVYRELAEMFAKVVSRSAGRARFLFVAAAFL